MGDYRKTANNNFVGTCTKYLKAETLTVICHKFLFVNFPMKI